MSEVVTELTKQVVTALKVSNLLMADKVPTKTRRQALWYLLTIDYLSEGGECADFLADATKAWDAYKHRTLHRDKSSGVAD